jgi:hypothetical protein
MRESRTVWASAPGTCTRLVGKEGEACQTCGRLIVRYDLPEYPGDYSLQHDGPSISQKLHALNDDRQATDELTELRETVALRDRSVTIRAAEAFGEWPPEGCE